MHNFVVSKIIAKFPTIHFLWCRSIFSFVEEEATRTTLLLVDRSPSNTSLGLNEQQWERSFSLESCASTFMSLPLVDQSPSITSRGDGDGGGDHSLGSHGVCWGSFRGSEPNTINPCCPVLFLFSNSPYHPHGLRLLDRGWTDWYSCTYWGGRDVELVDM